MPSKTCSHLTRTGFAELAEAHAGVEEGTLTGTHVSLDTRPTEGMVRGTYAVLCSDTEDSVVRFPGLKLTRTALYSALPPCVDVQ